MATKNGVPYVDFSNVCSSQGRFRFGANLSAAMSTSDDMAIYCRSNTLYFWNGSSETNITTGGAGVSSWDGLYDLDKSMTVDDSTVTFAGTLTSGNVFTVTGSAAVTGNLIDLTNSGSGKDIDGTASTWSVTSAGAVDAVSVTGDTMIAGDGSAAGVFKSSGNYDVTVKTGNATTSQMNITDGANGDVTFTMNGTGKVEIAGTTETNTAFAVTNGDAVISDGSLAITDDDNANSFALTNNTITTGDVVAITSTSLTEGNGVIVTANGLTTGYMVKAVTTAAGLTTGGAFLYDDGSARFAVKADGATAITTGVNSTKALEVTGIQTSENMVTFTSSGVTADDKASLLINPSGALASGSNIVRLAPSGAPNAGAILLEIVGASKTCQMMYIDGDSTAAAVVGINGGGALTDGLGVLNLTNDGNLASGGNVLNVTMGGTPNAAAAALEVSAAKDAYAFYVTSSAATNSGVYITNNGAIANNKAVVEIVATGTPANAGSNILRVDGSGITATNTPIAVEVDTHGKDATGLFVDSDAATGNAVLINGGGATADNMAVVSITSDGTPAAAGSNVLRVAFTGTATNKPTVAEIIGDGKDCMGLSVDADPTTTSAVYFHMDAALAADKAVLEIVSDAAAGNADSAVVRINQADAAGVANVLALVQTDDDKPFISFEAAVGVGNALEAKGGKTLTGTHFVMVDIEGVGARYIEVGTIA